MAHHLKAEKHIIYETVQDNACRMAFFSFIMLFNEVHNGIAQLRHPSEIFTKDHLWSVLHYG